MEGVESMLASSPLFSIPSWKFLELGEIYGKFRRGKTSQTQMELLLLYDNLIFLSFRLEPTHFVS